MVDRFLRASNASVYPKTSITGLEISPGGGRCIGVRTSDNVIFADDVIIAAGLGSTPLLPWTGLVPRRGQLIITDRMAGNLSLPDFMLTSSYLLEKREAHGHGQLEKQQPSGNALVIDRLATGQFLLGSTREADGNASHTEFDVVRKLLQAALQYVPAIAELNVIRVFAGIRAATKDGIPIVGAVADMSGLWVATGFEGDGICLAPLVGRELTKQVLGEPCLPAFNRLSPRRFDGLAS